jgi:hypothetical protein
MHLTDGFIYSIYYVEVTCYSFFDSIIRRSRSFSGGGAFRDAVVAVLSTRSPGGAAGVCVVEPHLPDPLWLAVHAFFNWDLSYNTVSAVARSLFLSQLLSIFFELLHVCLRRNEV